jgi:hypothetical protein
VLAHLFIITDLYILTDSCGIYTYITEFECKFFQCGKAGYSQTAIDQSEEFFVVVAPCRTLGGVQIFICSLACNHENPASSSPVGFPSVRRFRMATRAGLVKGSLSFPPPHSFSAIIIPMVPSATAPACTWINEISFHGLSVIFIVMDCKAWLLNPRYGSVWSHIFL